MLFLLYYLLNVLNLFAGVSLSLVGSILSISLLNCFLHSFPVCFLWILLPSFLNGEIYSYLVASFVAFLVAHVLAIGLSNFLRFARLKLSSLVACILVSLFARPLYIAYLLTRYGAHVLAVALLPFILSFVLKFLLSLAFSFP